MLIQVLVADKTSSDGSASHGSDFFEEKKYPKLFSDHIVGQV